MHKPPNSKQFALTYLRFNQFTNNETQQRRCRLPKGCLCLRLIGSSRLRLLPLPNISDRSSVHRATPLTANHFCQYKVFTSLISWILTVVVICNVVKFPLLTREDDWSRRCVGICPMFRIVGIVPSQLIEMEFFNRMCLVL